MSDDVEFYQFDNRDRRGGQHVGKTEAGVIAYDNRHRIGVVCNTERSQHKNKNAATALLPHVVAFGSEESPAPFAGTRDSLHTRVASVLLRSGVEDAQQLVRLLEIDREEIRHCMQNALEHWAYHLGGEANERKRHERALYGQDIGPPENQGHVASTGPAAGVNAAESQSKDGATGGN